MMFSLFKKLFRIKDPVRWRRDEADMFWRVFYKIQDWQKRQRAVMPSLEDARANVVLENGLCRSLTVARRILWQEQRNYVHTKDMARWGVQDYWPVSGEAWHDGKIREDCDGFAIEVWTRLFLKGFSVDQIGICLVGGHAFTILEHDSKDDFYIFDQGFLVRSLARASKTFPLAKYGEVYYPLACFNHKDVWTYRRANDV